MAQKIVTKEHGTHFFLKTWINATGAHVGLLEGGGYLHFSGLPINNKSDLMEVIPAGKDRDAAVEWWENRGKVKENEPKKRNIFLDLEGNLKFDDGTELQSVSDIINNTLPGPVQEAFLKEWHRKQEREDMAKMREAARLDKATKKIKAEALTKDAVE